MPIDPRISLGVQPLQIADPLAQYGQVQNILASQAQQRSAGTQQQAAELQLEQMRRDEATLKQIQDKAVQNGGPSDLNKIAEAYINSGNPKFVEFGVGLRQKLDEQAQFAKIMGLGSTSAPAMPSVAPAPGALGSGTFDPNAPVSAPMPTQAQRFAGSMGTNLPPVGAANQLAPAPAAPVNQLAPVADVSALRRKRDALLAMGTNQSIAAARAMDADIALASKEPAYQNVTGVGLVDPRTGRVIVKSVESTDPVVKQYEYAKDQGFVGTLFEFKRKLAEATRAPVQPVAPTITTVEDPTKPGSFLQVDARTYKGGGAGSPGVIGGARPSATAEKLTAQKTQLKKDLGFAITQLSDVTKDGGLIDQSTGSGAGRLVDLGARFAGKAMPGDIAIGKLAPIADLVLKMVPRFEGPQSDKDTQSYKEAAGQLANASLPAEIRKEAGKTVLRIMTERKNEFVTTDMAVEGAGAAQIAPPAGFVPDQR
jgi:hypothetical protein